MRILQRNLKRITETFLFISHTKNELLFKIRCNIYIGVRIIEEMPGSVASGTKCIENNQRHAVLSPTNALFINLVKIFKCTLKYTIISLLQVSVSNDHHHGALSVQN